MSKPIEIEIVNPNVPSHNLQQKIVTPSKETQVIKADDGYYGLSDVIVSPPVIDGEGLLEAINNVNTNVDEAETSINDNLKVVIDFANGEIDKIVDERLNERLAVDLEADY